eukprot:CAMPEP_0170175590 /NCGR_PEP_ID=MMETSP0040_2-20121228/8645_1 /TAXON_ID=641309 /ORGANISM="Lotharella oceanica, Strain CCMP622" /LENGTH=269 /DNA_ID=CAMNT_0010417633 /DNA_START=14 /DNA_END=823 /DNA_ORIENTATION=+
MTRHSETRSAHTHTVTPPRGEAARMGNKTSKGKSKSSIYLLSEALEDGVLDKKECEALFNRYDADKSGKIERHEIQRIVGDILKAKGQDAQEVDEMIKLGGFINYEKQLFEFFDKKDKDGKIDKEEFVDKFPQYVGALIKKTIKGEEAAILTLSQAMEDGTLDNAECKQLFKQYDKDSSGAIEREEIKNIIGDILKAKGQDTKEVDEMMEIGGFVHYEQQLFKHFDSGDKDGKIDEQEFVSKFPSYVASICKKDIKGDEAGPTEAKNAK